jgi:hypothetical protein
MRDLFDRGALTGNVSFGFDARYTFADGATHLGNHALSAEELSTINPSNTQLLHKHLLDNPAEQAILRWLDGHRRAGLALNKLAARANAAGYRTKLGRPWSTGSVDSVLHSRHTQLVLQPTPSNKPHENTLTVRRVISRAPGRVC